MALNDKLCVEKFDKVTQCTKFLSIQEGVVILC